MPSAVYTIYNKGLRSEIKKKLISEISDAAGHDAVYAAL